MTSPPVAGKRRSLVHTPSSEDQQLNIIAQEAETRLASSHAVLVEARHIRSTERERLRQASTDETDDIADDIPTDKPTSPTARSLSPPTTSSPVSTPVSTSLPDAPRVSSPVATTASSPVPAAVSNVTVMSKRSAASDPLVNGVPLKGRSAVPSSTVSDIEEKYKQVMMTNAQLDSEKQRLMYEVDLLKDRVADSQEHTVQLEHDLATTSRELSTKRSLLSETEMKCHNLQAALSHMQLLIKEQSMLYVSVDDMVPADDLVSAGSDTSALLPSELIQHLDMYEGSLGERLKHFFEEKLHFQSENKRLQHELELEKSRSSLGPKFQQSLDNWMSGNPGSSADVLDADSQKNITEYKWRLKRAEQEITTLQGNVTRLESQVVRYKSASEEAEKSEEELKLEKRRLLRELRESQTLVQELETRNTHLVKRLEKSKYRNVNDSN